MAESGFVLKKQAWIRNNVTSTMCLISNRHYLLKEGIKKLNDPRLLTGNVNGALETRFIVELKKRYAVFVSK